MSKDYNSWEDFVEEDDLPKKEQGLDDILQSDNPEVELPPDLKALLEKKERLENQLKKLTGNGDLNPEEERLKLMYPIKVHTKETRIEQRKERKDLDKKHFQKLEALERKNALKKAEEAEAAEREETLKNLKARRRFAEKWKQKKEKQTQEELLEAKKRKELQAKMDQKLLESLKAKKLLEAENKKVQEDMDNKLDKLKKEKVDDHFDAKKVKKQAEKKRPPIHPGKKKKNKKDWKNFGKTSGKKDCDKTKPGKNRKTNISTNGRKI